MSIYGKKRKTYSARLFKTQTGAQPIKIGQFESSDNKLEEDIKRTQKGALYGKCNVTACQKPGSALFYNRASMAFYCHRCAENLKRYNPDIDDMFPYFDAEMDAYFYATRSGITHHDVRQLFDVPQGVHSSF